MEKKKIIQLLEQNEVSDVEEIKYKDNVLVARFYYDFDETEIKAAKAFADDECTKNSGGEEWTNEFFLPYLTELAIDNVGEYIEEIMDITNVVAQFISYDVDPEEVEYCEFIAVFFNDEDDIQIESVLDELML